MSEGKQYITDRIKKAENRIKRADERTAKAEDRIVKANKKTKLAYIIIVIASIINAITIFVICTKL